MGTNRINRRRNTLQQQINKMKYEIIVYKSPLSSEVMAQFYTPELFTYWALTQGDLFPDQVSINGQTYLGWDEIEEALNK